MLLGRRAACACLASLLSVAGCKDRDAAASERAGPALERLLPLVERDCAQVREGLPEGAAKIAKLVDADPGTDLAGLQRAIAGARASVHKLVVAKSTFFVFADAQGTVLRSEVDPDLAAGLVLPKEIPDLARLFAPGAELVEAYGSSHGLRGVEKGRDAQWVVGAPVKDASGALRGAFLSGWSLRRYAHYLEEDVRRWLSDQQADKSKPIPLAYVFVVMADRAFGAPVTPDVNSEAVAKLEVVPKTRAAPWQGFIDVEGRRFAVAARAAPAMGAHVALVLLLSGV
jgi:hypothetical protein